jgi:Domain of unknown function (DUF4345)
MIGPLANILQLLCTLILIGLGARGMFWPDWSAGDSAATAMHHQLRFLNAILLTFGLFSLVYRKDILAGGLNCTIFLTGLFLGAFARAVSWVLDGTPLTASQLFLLFQTVTFLFVWLNARKAMAKP